MTNVERFSNFLENISLERVSQMEELYAEKVDFKDPLNEANDLAHLKRIEADLFKQLKDITFEVTSMQGTEEEAYVTWVMRKVDYQHDYWDASFPIYGEFPPLGWIMKGIKKLLAVPR